MSTALPTSRTTVDPAALAAYNRGVIRARRVNRAEQARDGGWCRVCAQDVPDHHAMCAKCRKRAQG